MLHLVQKCPDEPDLRSSSTPCTRSSALLALAASCTRAQPARFSGSDFRAGFAPGLRKRPVVKILRRSVLVASRLILAMKSPRSILTALVRSTSTHTFVLETSTKREVSASVTTVCDRLLKVQANQVRWAPQTKIPQPLVNEHGQRFSFE